MVDKEAVIMASIVIVIIAVLILGINIYNFNRYKYTPVIEENVSSDISSKQDMNTQNSENVIINTVNENHTNEVESKNIADQNTVEKKNETASLSTQKAETPEKTAINLAKKEFGNDISNVYFNVDEEISDGVYVVSVRNEETTTEITSYKVDIKNKSVTEN